MTGVSNTGEEAVGCLSVPSPAAPEFGGPRSGVSQLGTPLTERVNCGYRKLTAYN